MKPALFTALALSLGGCILPHHEMIGLHIGPGYRWVREGTSARDTQIAMLDCAEAVPDLTRREALSNVPGLGAGSMITLQQVIDGRGACMRDQGYVLLGRNDQVINRIL